MLKQVPAGEPARLLIVSEALVQEELLILTEGFEHVLRQLHDACPLPSRDCFIGVE